MESHYNEKSNCKTANIGNFGIKWAPYEIVKLMIIYPIMEVPDISKEMRRSIPAIANAASKLNLKKTNPTAELTKEYLIANYIESNNTMNQVAEKIGCNRKTIAYHLRKCNLPNKKISGSTDGRFVKGLIPWSKGLTKDNDYRLVIIGRKVKEANVNSRPGMHKKLSKTRKEYFAIPVNRERLRRIAKEAWQSPEFKAKISVIRKQMWKNPDYKNNTVQKILKGWHVKPTNPERQMIEIIDKYHLPFFYNGATGEVIIKGKVPDFVSTDGRKIIIEVFSRVFHDPKKGIVAIKHHQTESGRKKFYESKGWKCVVVWDDEIENNQEIIVKRIKDVS